MNGSLLSNSSTRDDRPRFADGIAKPYFTDGTYPVNRSFFFCSGSGDALDFFDLLMFVFVCSGVCSIVAQPLVSFRSSASMLGPIPYRLPGTPLVCVRALLAGSRSGYGPAFRRMPSGMIPPALDASASSLFVLVSVVRSCFPLLV